MTELFENIPNHVRKLTQYWIERAKEKKTPVEALQILTDFRRSLATEEEKDFLDFAVACNFYINDESEDIRSEEDA